MSGWVRRLFVAKGKIIINADAVPTVPLTD